MADLFGNVQHSQATLDFPQSLTERYRPHSITEFVGLPKPKALATKLAVRPYASAWRFVECNGQTVELIAGICPACQARHTSNVRQVVYTPQPKPHICNAKCITARGPNCECSCCGRNHGAGFILSGALFA